MKKKLFIIPLLFILCSCGGSNNDLNAFLKEFKNAYNDNFSFPYGIYYISASKSSWYNEYQNNESYLSYNFSYSIYAEFNFSYSNNSVLASPSVNWIDLTFDYAGISNNHEIETINVLSNQYGTNITGTYKNDNKEDLLNVYLQDYSIKDFSFYLYSTLSTSAFIKEQFKNINSTIEEKMVNSQTRIYEYTTYLSNTLHNHQYHQFKSSSMRTFDIYDYIYTFNANYIFESYAEEKTVITDMYNDCFLKKIHSQFNFAKIDGYKDVIIDTSLPKAKYISTDNIINPNREKYFDLDYNYLKQLLTLID